MPRDFELMGSYNGYFVIKIDTKTIKYFNKLVSWSCFSPSFWTIELLLVANNYSFKGCNIHLKFALRQIQRP